MTKHQVCCKCGASFIGPDCGIGSNHCTHCGPSIFDWSESWDAMRENIQADPNQPPEIINWALSCVDAFDPR